jgi:carbamoyl-phosphate synthase large subunit
MLKNKNIFVSGGAGVIGCEMVAKLLAQGATVFVGDLKPCPPEWKGKLRYRQGDLNFLEPAEIESFAPEIFIHLAATFERSTESYEFWKENFWNNVRLSNYLMTLVKDIPSLKKVAFASSYLIYDPSLYLFTEAKEKPEKLRENDPIYPRNLTGMAKLSHEIELRFLEQFRSGQYQIVIPRIFRGYGKNSRDVISRWVRSLLTGEEITVFRKEGWFDYIYAKDTAEGLIRLVASESAKGIINLGTGRSKKVSDVLGVLKKHFPKMKVREENLDILYEASEGEISGLISLTGWRPEYDIETAIPEIIEFEKNKKAVPLGKVPLGNILITSASRKIPLLSAVKQAAAKLSPDIKVFAGDTDSGALSSFVADGFWNMPRTDDENAGQILAWCLENNIKCIIPTRDGELLFWSKSKESFLKHDIHVMISGMEEVKRCVDKLEFSEYCSSAGIPAVPSYLKIEDCKSDLYVVKEQNGAGSISIGIGLGRDDARKHAMSLQEPIFQPFIKGVEVSIDAYVDKRGAVHGVVLRRRDKIVHGEAQVTTTIRDEKVEKLLPEMVQKLNLYGHIILQAIIDEHDMIHVIECNCRFGGASTLSVKAGLDSFYWFFLEAMGGDLRDYPFIMAHGQMRQVRVPHDIYFHGTDL